MPAPLAPAAPGPGGAHAQEAGAPLPAAASAAAAPAAHVAEVEDKLECVSASSLGSASLSETANGVKLFGSPKLSVVLNDAGDLSLVDIPDSQDPSHPDFQEPQPNTVLPSRPEAGEEAFREALDSIGGALVTQVVMAIQHHNCKYNVAFDFDPQRDTAILVAKELLDAGIAPQGILLEDLSRDIEHAIIARCAKIKVGGAHAGDHPGAATGVSPSAAGAAPAAILATSGIPPGAAAVAVSTGLAAASGAGTPHVGGHGHRAAIPGASSGGALSTTVPNAVAPEYTPEGFLAMHPAPENTLEAAECESARWGSLGWIAGVKHPLLSAELCRDLAGDDATAALREHVILLQRSLAYLIPAVQEDDFKQTGDWCDATSKAVVSFQEYHSLTNEKGVVDEKFWEMLSDQVKKKDVKEAQKRAKREEDRRKKLQVQEQRKQQQNQESAVQFEAMMGLCKMNLDEKVPGQTGKQEGTPSASTLVGSRVSAEPAPKPSTPVPTGATGPH